jgi:hypothetical protein
MFLGWLVLVTALSISAVAIYYSVSGLVAIFAAAALPIIVMGSVLELGKLVTAVWLHKYWNQARWWLKTYLAIATVVLMFITSMGIFGFLSKAHIEQTAAATEGIARIELIDSEIAKQQRIVDRAELEIAKLETAGKNNDTELQAQIDKEQQRIDSAYTRVQPAIDEQNEIIRKEEQRLAGSLLIYEDQLVTVNDNLQKIEQYIASNSIKELQALVGVKADGSLGPATSSAIESFRVAQTTEKQRLAELIASERSKLTSPVIDAARTEIQRLRTVAEEQIAQSNELINRLREQLGTEDKTTTDADIAVEEEKIQTAEAEIATLSEEKYKLEAEYRKLEAEVGPVKYLAEFVYGETADQTLLEDAVKWVIVIIIFVFDPLAVLLLIASQATFEFVKSNKTAQRQNKETTNDTKIDDNQHVIKHEQHASDETNNTRNKLTGDEEDTFNTTSELRDNAGTGSQGRDLGSKQITLEAITDENIQSNTVTADDAGRVTVSKNTDAGTDESNAELESTEIQLDESEQEKRRRHVEEIELLEDVKISKQKWKEENPDATIKLHKDAYIKGKIEKLPWDNGYSQNSEQSDNSIWSKIKPKDE